LVVVAALAGLANVPKLGAAADDVGFASGFGTLKLKPPTVPALLLVVGAMPKAGTPVGAPEVNEVPVGWPNWKIPAGLAAAAVEAGMAAVVFDCPNELPLNEEAGLGDDICWVALPLPKENPPVVG